MTTRKRKRTTFRRRGPSPSFRMGRTNDPVTGVAPGTLRGEIRRLLRELASRRGS